ncbi:hypothetical protein HUJ05_008574 [Dendroctonus ponderosae]|nr:hypothetical protein HUJ05_008680 [Dendroctonus ponderosae]KAH0998475.1 hypothetical protein HUJ05_008574 [Dendroctonus ponderosae]
MIYRLSYLWYTLMGTLVAIIVGVTISFFSKPNDPRDVDPKLLAPFLRRWIKPRKYPNETMGDEIIYAYTPTTFTEEALNINQLKPSESSDMDSLQA